ncbi:MAG: efflux RND transporter periplasmic adaptor subunit [Selenomonadaceae bacterium]|nr:efflux RND transporter periplasmic adaptor subunit [Selenomonadaceae bacterium]
MTTLFFGCGNEDQQAKQPQKAQVKAMKVIQRDTPLTSEFAGQILAANEVKVQSKVTGNVVEKYVVGGQFVSEGQPLYKIDSRNYESAVLKAQADLAQSEATLNNAKIDLYRDQKLLEDAAIAEQVVTTQAAQVRAYEAQFKANEALLQTAIDNLEDTMIYSPMSGQLSVDDVAVGTFVSAGQTNLVTIGSSNPIYAQFSVSEAEYLKFLNVQALKSEQMTIDVTLTLADGTEYPFVGRIVESDRELANNTGSLTIKALFPNPSGLLLPGMFARVKLSGDTRPNSILVPQRAVQQLLGKSFVMVVGKDGKSETRTVELDDKVGSYYIIKSGITPQDTVIVEGLTNLQEGVDLAVTEVTAGEMGFTLSEVTSAYNADSATPSAGSPSANSSPNQNSNNAKAQ